MFHLEQIGYGFDEHGNHGWARAAHDPIFKRSQDTLNLTVSFMFFIFSAFKCSKHKAQSNFGNGCYSIVAHQLALIDQLPRLKRYYLNKGHQRYLL